MTSIYELYDAAFKQVSAYVIVRNGARIGTLAFKFPKDGAGRLYAYLHIHGLTMTRGQASGYGYDKRSAAYIDALRKTKIEDGANPLDKNTLEKLQAIKNVDSIGFDSAIREAGFELFSAV